MTRNLTARVASIAFGVELAFACAIPIAYLHLFDIDEGGDRAVVIGMAAALYVVRTAGLITWLALLLRPIDRWLKQPDAAGAQLTLGAARAAYDTPLAFSIVWATTWLVFYWPVTAILQSRFADRIPLTPRAGAATILFGISCFSAALPLAYSLLTRLLGPVAGRISLAARERGVALPGRRVSLRVRLVVLSLSLIAAPTVWLTLTSYMSQVWTGQRDLAARAERLADAVAQAPASHGPGTPLDLTAIASRDGTVRDNAEAARELFAAPALRFRLARELSRKDSGTVLDPSSERAAGYRAIPGSRDVALVISRPPGRDHRAEVFDLLFFALVAASWAPVCAIFLAGSIAGPLQRIRRVVSQIVGREDVDKLGRIPVFHRDEIGDHAVGANETIDRLQASAARIRRYGADREQLPAAAARRAPALDAAVAVARDVTEVVELDRLKDQFIRVAAHELKTPVAILKGYALTLMRTDKTLSPRSRRMLEAIDRGAERINRIVEDLVDVSQAFLDVLQLLPETVDLEELVRASVAGMPHTEMHRISVRRGAPGPFNVSADQAR